MLNPFLKHMLFTCKESISGKEVMRMADKKGNCGCGCIGEKQGSPKATDDKKKPRKSK
jgi:hypothetical protein